MIEEYNTYLKKKIKKKTLLRLKPQMRQKVKNFKYCL